MAFFAKESITFGKGYLFIKWTATPKRVLQWRAALLNCDNRVYRPGRAALQENCLNFEEDEQQTMT